MNNKIIRTICLFTGEISDESFRTLEHISKVLRDHRFIIQTKRICLSHFDNTIDDRALSQQGVLLSVGQQSMTSIDSTFNAFIKSDNIAINLDLTKEQITSKSAEILSSIIKTKPDNTFRFTYGFNLPASSPFFPSARFEQKGFAIGLQPTDLSEGCSSLSEWFAKMDRVWDEIDKLLAPVPGYMGIDSSIAPLYEGSSSLVNFIKRLGYSFSRSATTNIYTTISQHIKTRNPRPVGLCGLMFPCLEDFELAEEYENGNFSIERNIFMSLHSGLGIDTYPIAVDQDLDRVVEILRLVQRLSNRYSKPLSVRFVSDGKAKVGERSNFNNQYLKDVCMREL